MAITETHHEESACVCVSVCVCVCVCVCVWRGISNMMELETWRMM